MTYRVIGLMSGSSLDGLDIAFVELEQASGQWKFSVIAAESYSYPSVWVQRLSESTRLSSREYLLLHADYGHYLGELVNRFIEEKELQFKVQLIASHGHTTFHIPERKMTAQLGEGAAIAASTGIHTVSDLRAMDVALGGQGAPIVPIGDQMLWPGFDYYLNLGGIANITWYTSGVPHAFDICPANRVLNLLAGAMGKPMDAEGAIARSGAIDLQLLEKLNALPYYQQPSPKSLANDFGSELVFPLVLKEAATVPDGLRTYAEHIAMQIAQSVAHHREQSRVSGPSRLLVTGGGAHNSFLMERLQTLLHVLGVEAIVPDAQTVDFKEAIVMAFMGVLRWREEHNVLSSVTGSVRDSVGGAFWLGR